MKTGCLCSAAGFWFGMDKRQYVLMLGEWPRKPGSSAVPSESERYKFLGHLSLNGAHPSEPWGKLPHLGTAENLREYIFRNPVDIVVVSAPLSSALSKELLEPILEIGLTLAVPDGITVSLAPSILEKIFTRREPLLGAYMTLLTTVRQRRSYLRVKRVIDCVISTAALILLAPLFLLIALAIKLNSARGSMFYAWQVLGKNGKPFVGYKFRTMVPEADKLKEQLLAFNEMQGPVFKMRNDPRIFPFGRFLRKFSLDELPQLYSVLRGDMSLVGPRPPSAMEAERFEFWQRRKLSVKPGISCLWQVNGRNEIRDFNEWVHLDLEYIEKASFFLDLKIMLLTIPAVLSGRGAS
jgi:lipopolysaccharide/colanic/teichoic acid biosynthesis glycosyltransferase